MALFKKTEQTSVIKAPKTGMCTSVMGAAPFPELMALPQLSMWFKVSLGYMRHPPTPNTHIYSKAKQAANKLTNKKNKGQDRVTDN